MRRVVPKELRKKALFSCDLCKKKKVACKRTIKGNNARHEDTTVACDSCIKRGHECTTTIKRKRRQMGPVENIGLHYKCLSSLVQGLFPDLDVNNIDLLIEVGLKMQIDMPSRETLSQNSTDLLYDLGYSINSHINRMMASNQLDFCNLEDDRFVLDNSGVSHYIGPRGAATFLAHTSTLMENSHDVVSDNFKVEYDKIYNEEVIVSSGETILTYNILKEINVDTFPFVELNKQATDSQIEVFFSRIYPYYTCFSRNRFMRLYDKIWTSSRVQLTSAEVCFIYLIKIMGFYYQPGDDELFESEKVGQLVSIVRLSLAEFMLTPTIDGILCLFFLAVFFGKNKRRECGYLLITLACRQAIAIGLNRQSMIECYPDFESQEEAKKIWWAIFEQEVKFSNLLGRASSLSIGEVTTEYPVSQSNVDEFFFHTIKLLKIVYMINQVHLKSEGKTASFGAKDRAKIVAIRLQFSEWLESVKDYMNIEDPSITAFKHRLDLEHKYYNISLLSPFIMNLTTIAQIDSIPEFDLQMVVECLQYAIGINSILDSAERRTMSNAFWSPHIIYAYECVLCLCNVYIWMSQRYYEVIKDSMGRSITLEQIKSTMKSLRQYNQQHIMRSKGSISKLSKHIETMLGNFRFMHNMYEAPLEFDLNLLQSYNKDVEFVISNEIDYDQKVDFIEHTYALDDIFFGEALFS